MILGSPLHGRERRNLHTLSFGGGAGRDIHTARETTFPHSPQQKQVLISGK